MSPPSAGLDVQPLFPPAVLDQLPFVMMSHPLISAGLAPASVSMAMGQMNRLSTLASMANAAHLHAKPLSRAPTSVIKVNPEASRWMDDGWMIESSFVGFCRSACWTVRPPPRPWRTLTCPITAAACPARRLTRKARQKPQVCAAAPRRCGAAAQRPDRSSVLFMQPVPAATLDNGLPSGPGPLGHCPAVGPEAAAPADVCRENKRSQNHRGESCCLRVPPEHRQNSSGSADSIQL